ncbi:gamma-glutamylcyclotransferase family protein [Brevundimonas sp.]|uniref:gamma-glutamylcyclotransferase family protein n=1 Tax=Brevundimonas sp. TaxID=1871086 RepID=UPI002C1CBC6C|nr:gamma-glutamylcyclotransferase family protein [Brevundimonas sp.]HWQ87863.1 gamma-glutamylcyclotransferase family protein [Brevundimonas sp.]
MPRTNQVDPVVAADRWLFSYGTLRQPEVQLANFGRPLEGRNDVLEGYVLSMIEITDPEVIAISGSNRHPMVRRTDQPDDRVEGVAFRVTAAEIAAADAYETSDYVRVTVILGSGLEADVYVSSPAD